MAIWVSFKQQLNSYKPVLHYGGQVFSAVSGDYKPREKFRECFSAILNIVANF